MGEFILLEAENQAEEHGVASEGIVRQGKIGEEILELCKELEADYVTLGRPRGEVESDFFTHPMLDELGGKIKSESNAQVVYVREVDTNED